MTRLSSAQRLQLLRSVYLFQVVLLNSRPKLVSTARHFPDQIFDATVLLALELKRQGYTDLAVRTLTSPQLEAPPTEVWLQVEDLHLEWVPAERPLQPLTLSARRPSWMGAAAGWCWPWPELLPTALAADDAQLQAVTQMINLDRLTSPLREVVDQWRGMDVLSCGHLAAANNLINTRKRRCTFCESVLPAKVFRAVTGNREALEWFALLGDEERGAAISALFTAQLGAPGSEQSEDAGLD